MANGDALHDTAKVAQEAAKTFGPGLKSGILDAAGAAFVGLGIKLGHKLFTNGAMEKLSAKVETLHTRINESDINRQNSNEAIYAKLKEMDEKRESANEKNDEFREQTIGELGEIKGILQVLVKNK